jgi:hypothetical protein
VKRFLATFIALLVVALLWFVLHGGASVGTNTARDTMRDAPARQPEQLSADATHDADIDRTRTLAAADAARDSQARPSLLEVVSSTHLPLAFVELEIEPRYWQRRALVDGHCDLSHDRVPCGIRAPGHVASIVQRAEGVVVLEPDALLELDGEHLQECMPTIVPYGSWVRGSNDAARETAKEVDAICTSGFVDARRWLLTIDVDRIGRWFPDSKDVEIVLGWRDRRAGYIQFAASHGARARWDVPCENVADTQPLDVTFVRTADASAGAIDAILVSVADNLAAPEHVDLPWGRVQLNSPLQTYVRTRVAPDSSRLHLDGIALGRKYLLTARDLGSGAFGCFAIEHDGSARTLVLHPGIVITGRVTVAPGAPLPVHARCIWSEVGDIGSRSGRWVGVSNAAFEEDGRFELRGWTNLPSDVAECSTNPSRIELTIDAAGCASSTTAHEVDATGHCECGEIQLESRSPQFVLMSGHGVPDDPLQHAALRISTKPEWSFIDVWGRSLADGTYALYLSAENPKRDPDAFLAWSNASPNYRGVHLREFASENIPAIILDRNNSEGIAFQLASDGRYERVPVRKYAIDVDCRALPHDAQRWTIGWSWSKMVQRVDSLSADAVGERRRIEFTAPENGASFWWSAGDRVAAGTDSGAGQGGSLELNHPSTALELP